MLFLNVCLFAGLLIGPSGPVGPSGPSGPVGPKVLFFTGGNSLMPADIYTEFIYKLEKKYDVTVIRNSNKDSLAVLEQIYTTSYSSDIIPIGHSSGCTTLINSCSKLSNVRRCVLLDPVNNNVKAEYLSNKYYDSMLQINAQKSYEWKLNNPFASFGPFSNDKSIKNKDSIRAPFIPAFAMKTNKFSNLIKIDIQDYGHCDILDTAFSNMMHYSLAEGNDDRTTINHYKDLLIYLIDSYINDYTIEYDRFNIDYVRSV
jgi:hypothetical protein